MFHLPDDFDVCKTSPIKSLIRNDGFGHSMMQAICDPIVFHSLPG